MNDQSYKHSQLKLVKLKSQLQPLIDMFKRLLQKLFKIWTWIRYMSWIKRKPILPTERNKLHRKVDTSNDT